MCFQAQIVMGVVDPLVAPVSYNSAIPNWPKMPLTMVQLVATHAHGWANIESLIQGIMPQELADCLILPSRPPIGILALLSMSNANLPVNQTKSNQSSAILKGKSAVQQEASALSEWEPALISLLGP